MILRQVLITVVLSLSFFGHTYAQPSPSTGREIGLTLEVTFLKGRPPGYLAVGPTSTNAGGWFAMFGRIPGWQLPKDAQPINAVRLVPYLKGEAVNVDVSVLRGQYLDTESKVASYTATESEGITVNELRAFGVEPFVIKVVRASGYSDLPTTRNKTKSISITGLEPIVATLPRYKLTLNNLSEKDISALHLKVMHQGQFRLGKMPQGDLGQPVIKAKDSTSLNQSLAVVAATGSSGPSALVGQEIVVESLIFADGSYEGELHPVGNFLAFVVGRRTELKRLIHLFDETISASGTTSADRFRSQLTSLSYEADKGEVALLTKAFPTLDKAELEYSVDVTIHTVREKLLDQLTRLEKGEGETDAFSGWLVRTRQNYRQWLSNLEAINVSQGRSK